MKERLIALLAVALLAGACTSQPEQAGPSAPPTETPSPQADFQTESQVYAAVIRRLVTKDHTFGGGPSPFGYVYVVDGAIPGAGNPMKNFRQVASEPFADDLKQEILDRLTDLPPVEFVLDPDDVREGKNGMGGVEDFGVIITLGLIERKAAKVHVSNRLWCGGLCGQWLTYVLEPRGNAWRITGTTGPYAIS